MSLMNLFKAASIVNLLKCKSHHGSTFLPTVFRIQMMLFRVANRSYSICFSVMSLMLSLTTLPSLVPLDPYNFSNTSGSLSAHSFCSSCSTCLEHSFSSYCIVPFSYTEDFILKLEDWCTNLCTDGVQPAHPDQG